MKMKQLSIFSTTAILLMGALSAEAAPIYDYSINNPNGGSRAGDIQNVSTSYNNNQFSWSHSIAKRNDRYSDAFWLVVNDGPNPKGIAGQLAILYGDLNSNKLQAYEYNGRNGNNSYLTSNLLDSWDNAMSINVSDTGIQTVSFNIDVSHINNADIGADWEGIAFAEKIGIWFHPSAKSSIAYDQDTNEMTSYATRKQSWLDNNNQSTTMTSVPEPASIALLSVGIAGLVVSRRQTKSSV